MILMNDSSRMMTEHLVEMSHYCNGDRTRDLNYDRTSGRNVPWLHSWPDPWPNLWPDPWADPRPDPCPDPWPMSRRAVEMSRDWTRDQTRDLMSGVWPDPCPNPWLDIRSVPRRTVKTSRHPRPDPRPDPWPMHKGSKREGAGPLK